MSEKTYFVSICGVSFYTADVDSDFRTRQNQEVVIDVRPTGTMLTRFFAVEFSVVESCGMGDANMRLDKSTVFRLWAFIFGTATYCTIQSGRATNNA